MKIEAFMPLYNFHERHEITIKAPPEVIYRKIQELDLNKSWLIRILFRMRGLKSASFQDIKNTFTVLLEIPDQEIVLGLVARPWTIKGGLVKISAENFLKFNDPNYIKGTWNFCLAPKKEGTRVITETRIQSTDQESKKKFGRYWFFIRPFSGLIRLEILRLLKKDCEKTHA